MFQRFILSTKSRSFLGYFYRRSFSRRMRIAQSLQINAVGPIDSHRLESYLVHCRGYRQGFRSKICTAARSISSSVT